MNLLCPTQLGLSTLPGQQLNASKWQHILVRATHFGTAWALAGVAFGALFRQEQWGPLTLPMAPTAGPKD